MKRSEIAAYEVFCGIDVGKSSNYAVVLDRSGDVPLIRRPVAQSEREIRSLLAEVSQIGRPLVTVDQYGAFGRLVVAVAKDAGIDVAHIPPRKFKQVAETYDEGKSDAKDAFIIADTSRSQPRNIELVADRSDALAEVRVLSVARDDAVRERTRLYNRLHDLIGQACPTLEAVFTKQKLHNELELMLIARYGGPVGFRRAGKSRASRWAGSLKYHRNTGPAKVEEVFDAIESQAVAMPAAEAIERQARKIASRILELEAEESDINAEIERASAALPEVAILQSVPGIGKVYGAVIASEIADIGRFPSASHLASYGGVAPVREESGTSVRRSKKRKGGNRRLKNALVQSAYSAVMHDDGARRYYEKKRAEGRGHKQALRALARRRVDLIYALLANGTFYDPSTPAE